MLLNALIETTLKYVFTFVEHSIFSHRNTKRTF